MSPGPAFGRLSSWLGAVLALALLAPSAPAWAHGPTPAVIGVAAQSQGQPTALLLSQGLAVRETDGWHWQCSAAWAGPVAPLALSADGLNLWISGTGGLYRLDTSGALTAVAGTEALSSFDLRRLAAAGGNVYALSVNAAGSIVWRLDAAGPVQLWQSAHAESGFACDDAQIYLAHGEGEAVALTLLDLQGAESSSRLLPSPAAGLTPTLRATGGALYLLSSGPDDYRLGRIDGDAVNDLFASASPLHGPATSGTAQVALSDGVLYAVGTDALTALDAAEHFTCLTELDGESWTCAQSVLYPLTPSGPAADTAFTLAELLSPSIEGLPRAVATDCTGQWLDFASDAGIDIGDLEPPGGSGGGDSSGCSVGAASRAGGALPVLLVVLALVGGRRRRVGKSGQSG